MECHFSSFCTSILLPKPELVTTICRPKWEFPGETTVYKLIRGTGAYYGNEEIVIHSFPETITDKVEVEIRCVSKVSKDQENWKNYWAGSESFWVKNLKDADRELLTNFTRFGKPDAYLKWGRSEETGSWNSLPKLIINLGISEFETIASGLVETNNCDLRMIIDWIYAVSTTMNFEYSWGSPDRITWVCNNTDVIEKESIPFIGNLSQIELIQKNI